MQEIQAAWLSSFPDVVLLSFSLRLPDGFES